ncbi:MAG TPA: hypothetical protein PK362_09975, partial [Elusimicrobiota bacterium]|nr:hypothetical protein [Elusimicrobiota bacterium]
RPGLISDVDLHLLLPDDLASPAPDNPLGAAYEALYYGLEKVLGAQDPKPLKDFQHAGDVEHAMAFWEPKSNQMGSSYTGVDALRVYGLTARPVAGNADLFEEGVRPAYRQLLSRYRREILRGVILEREAQFESADSSLLRPDFKAGLGGVREYDTITWMSRFLFPRGAEGLVGLLTGWTVLAAQRRVSLPQLLRARQAFLRQARLRDRRVDFDQLSREEKIQYVQDAGLLFDTLVSLLQSYWLEVRRPQDPEYLPFFLASAGWRPRSAANVQRQLDEDLSRREGRLVAVRARRSGAEGMAEFAIEALRDRPGVLAVLSGLMAAHGFSIRAAEAQFERGRVFDRFYVHLGPLAAADKKAQDREIDRLGRAVENAAADVLAGERIELGRVAADFADAGRAYLFVLPRRHPVAATLAFFTGRAGARALTVLTSDRVLGGDEDQKEFLGTLHVITRWLAERGYNIVGDPSIRTQRGIVL